MFNNAFDYNFNRIQAIQNTRGMIPLKTLTKHMNFEKTNITEQLNTYQEALILKEPQHVKILDEIKEEIILEIINTINHTISKMH